ncbi:MAG: chemotaxis protein CheW [Kofleriaceae bacterium]|nr:chemotaxis protein CheW [Kofleriaceae bacterium]
MPLVRLGHVLERTITARPEQLHVVLTEQGGVTYGLVCDHLLGKKEIVIKSLGPPRWPRCRAPPARPCSAIAAPSSSTRAGDRAPGRMAAPAGARRARRDRRASARAAARRRRRCSWSRSADIVRESLRRLAVDAGGCLVTVAVDGRTASSWRREPAVRSRSPPTSTCPRMAATS